jgi:hypothetical protein
MSGIVMRNKGKRPVGPHKSLLDHIKEWVYGVDEDWTNREDYLKRFLRKRRRLATQMHIGRRTFYLLGAAMFLISPLLVNQPKDYLYFFAYGSVFLLMGRYPNIEHIEHEISDAESELDLLHIGNATNEQRAQKLFRLHQIDLKRYYDQTLNQSAWIFYVGVGCIFVGIMVIAVTIYLVSANRFTTTVEEKVFVAALGAIGAVLVNFVAVVYMRMFSGVMQSLTHFHNRLVATHHLIFGNFLAAKIENRELREETLAKVAEALSTAGPEYATKTTVPEAA